jgi:hypothetical protein
LGHFERFKRKAPFINARKGGFMKPTLFIGCSKEGLEIARAVQVQLEKDAEVTIWNEGVFGLGMGTLESLERALANFDFAILILTPDDIIISRGDSSQSPRDNILLELGMFIGRLGRDRTFIVYNRDAALKLPSDLAGVSMADFGDRKDGNMISALGPACTKISYSLKSLGTSQRSQKSKDGGQEALSRPYVIAKVEPHLQGNVAVAFDLVVHNTGTAPAKNIRLSVDKGELESALLPRVNEALKIDIENCFSEGGMIPVLENGQFSKARNSFGIVSLKQEDSTWKPGTILNVKISYQDMDGILYGHEIPLKIGDNSSFAGGSWAN